MRRIDNQEVAHLSQLREIDRNVDGYLESEQRRIFLSGHLEPFNPVLSIHYAEWSDGFHRKLNGIGSGVEMNVLVGGQEDAGGQKSILVLLTANQIIRQFSSASNVQYALESPITGHCRVKPFNIVKVGEQQITHAKRGRVEYQVTLLNAGGGAGNNHNEDSLAHRRLDPGCAFR